MGTKQQLDYYSFQSLVSRNATYNFVVGGRGLGKTYGAKLMAIRDYIKNGAQFIYLRRYKTELSTRTTFFSDIAVEFPGYSFRVRGHEAQITTGDPEDKKCHWETIGFFMALSSAQSRKSVSYPRVRKIIFDEFILEDGALHYLPKEDEILNNLYSTIDRWDDRVKVFFLANSVSIMNPYFMAYDIEPNQEWVTRASGFIVAHFPDSEKFNSQVLTTKFGRFIAGTEYANYAVGNVFKDNHSFMVAKKESEAYYYCSIETKLGVFSVWADLGRLKPQQYFIQESRPKKEVIYTLQPELMDTGKIYVTYSDKLLQYLRTAFSQGRVSFDSAKTRNSFIPIFKR